MKPYLVLAVVVLASLSQADLKSATSGTYKKISQAFLKKDVKAFEAATHGLMTKDFKFYDHGKPMNYNQMVATLKETFATIDKVKSAEAHIVSVKETGGKATSLTSHMMVGTMKGPDKKSHDVTMGGTTKDTWVKEGKTWKLSSMTWLKQTMTMDGKPFDPSKLAVPAKAKSDSK